MLGFLVVWSALKLESEDGSDIYHPCDQGQITSLIYIW